MEEVRILLTMTRVEDERLTSAEPCPEGRLCGSCRRADTVARLFNFAELFVFKWRPSAADYCMAAMAVK